MTGSARTAITNPTQLPPTNAASSAARAAYPGCTTEKWSVHAILLVLDVAAPRGRADARGESDPGRSRQEHLPRCLGRSLQRLAAATAASCASCCIARVRRAIAEVMLRSNLPTMLS